MFDHSDLVFQILLTGPILHVELPSWGLVLFDLSSCTSVHFLTCLLGSLEVNRSESSTENRRSYTLPHHL